MRPSGYFETYAWIKKKYGISKDLFSVIKTGVLIGKDVTIQEL